MRLLQFLNFEIRPCEEDDAEFFHEKIDEISDSIAPPAEGAEDKYVFLKITYDEGKIIAGIGTYLLSDFEREAKEAAEAALKILIYL